MLPQLFFLSLFVVLKSFFKPFQADGECCFFRQNGNKRYDNNGTREIKITFFLEKNFFLYIFFLMKVRAFCKKWHDKISPSSCIYIMLTTEKKDLCWKTSCLQPLNYSYSNKNKWSIFKNNSIQKCF